MQQWTTAQVYSSILPNLNEKQKRLYVASEALRLGYGGISYVARHSGISRVTITNGVHQLKLKQGAVNNDWRIRQAGGGRKPLSDRQEGVVEAVKRTANPKGNPMHPILHTSHSMEHISNAVQKQGYTASRMSVYRILKNAGFALKANKKTIEGVKNHPDRDRQFQHINKVGLNYQIQGKPIVSVDCKKKELIGNFKNNGREWQERGTNTHVNVYDFKSLAEGKAVPYGIYDIINKKGFVNVGISGDTAEFSVESIRRWWKQAGKTLYPKSTELLVLADGGGSNGSRNRLWKHQLQVLANETRLDIQVCHYPPYTSKWNAIEHELFSFISINWRAKPLLSLEVIIEVISNTTTKAGLTVQAVKDSNTYPTGIKITDKEMKKLHIIRDEFHGDWNYKIKPQITL
jgi:transposase